MQGISKLSGQAKASTYPQPEGTLGDAMANFGNKLMDFDNRYASMQGYTFFLMTTKHASMVGKYEIYFFLGFFL